MRIRVIGCLGALVLAWSAVLWGQSAPQTPAFRSGVNLILVDVTVRDRKGEPVRNRKASDF